MEAADTSRMKNSSDGVGCLTSSGGSGGGSNEAKWRLYGVYGLVGLGLLLTGAALGAAFDLGGFLSHSGPVGSAATDLGGTKEHQDLSGVVTDSAPAPEGISGIGSSSNERSEPDETSKEQSQQSTPSGNSKELVVAYVVGGEGEGIHNGKGDTRAGPKISLHPSGNSIKDEDAKAGLASKFMANADRENNYEDTVGRNLRGKAKSSKGKSSKGDTRFSKGGKDHKRQNPFNRNNQPICDIEDFVGVRTYSQVDDLCEKMFESVIICDGTPGNRDLCTYEEQSMDGGSTSLGTCVAFDPSADLKYDPKSNQCVIGMRRGLKLKDQSDPVCNVKYNVKIVKEMNSQEVDDSTLLLYFSDDGGKIFYNMDTPRVATKDKGVRTRRMQVCTDFGSRCYYDSDCVSEICYRQLPFPVNYYGVCKDCNHHSECAAQVTQPPAGEFGKPFCDDDMKCVAHVLGESRIPEEGYPTWVPSETLDNSYSFPKIAMPRRVLENPGPVFEQVWYIDLNEQEESFNKEDVRVNGTHIQIPSFTPIHAGYSTSFHQYDEHETGISTFIAGKNDVSMVTPYPKAWFVEKKHTLTYNGVKDTSRGDFIRQKSDEALSESWAHNSWLRKALDQFVTTGLRNSIPQEIEAGIDRAIAWQVRRYARSHQDDHNPNISSSWAAHTEKAKRAIAYAKNSEFNREYPKSEQICYHMEEGYGVDASETHITLPLGRPSTTISGQMVNSPVYFLGFTVGHFTVYYDDNEGILQLYYQAYSSSRQYTDVKFPGPYPSALYVSPVAEGSDYVVDPNTDGRHESLMTLTSPGNDPTWFLHRAEPFWSLWARPETDTCAQDIRDEDFWESIKIGENDESIFSSLAQNIDLLNGVVRGMPCARDWMSSDYGPGTNTFGPNEYAVWAHFLYEAIPDKTEEVGLAKYWNSWECFYAGGGQSCPS